MSDYLDRAAELIAATDATERGYDLDAADVAIGHTIAMSLDAAGLLVTKERRPDEERPRPMPEFSPERARLLAERPAHPWTPPDGPTLHRPEDIAEEFGVDLTEGDRDE